MQHYIRFSAALQEAASIQAGLWGSAFVQARMVKAA